MSDPSKLEQLAVRQAQAEALAVLGDSHVYLERAIMPARHVEVQVMENSRQPDPPGRA